MAAEHGTTLDFDRHGGEHDVYRIDGMPVYIPRHREINERLAGGILRRAERHLERQ